MPMGASSGACRANQEGRLCTCGEAVPELYGLFAREVEGPEEKQQVRGWREALFRRRQTVAGRLPGRSKGPPAGAKSMKKVPHGVCVREPGGRVGLCGFCGQGLPNLSRKAPKGFDRLRRRRAERRWVSRDGADRLFPAV